MAPSMPLIAPEDTSIAHGELMDGVYRWQRHIYDATRKYFLFGRDRLIGELQVPYGGAVLEIGCGTGRNLALIGRRWPKAQLHGLDISALMLESAQARLGIRAQLAVGDACTFDAQALFGRASFDRVVISFALSMIPDWQAALRQGASVLAAGGELHIVDFGPAHDLPAPLRGLLNAWLRHFHVTPRLDLVEVAREILGSSADVEVEDGPLGYYRRLVIRRPR
jgi:S-adenosylmethionine-diacylgycerolhomoserine-N-methlytransferase